jgi:hypothetical protein
MPISLEDVLTHCAWMRGWRCSTTVTFVQGRSLDSAVMTTQAESRISHGLLVVECWLTDPSTDVALVSIVLSYHMFMDMTHS